MLNVFIHGQAQRLQSKWVAHFVDASKLAGVAAKVVRSDMEPYSPFKRGAAYLHMQLRYRQQ